MRFLEEIGNAQIWISVFDKRLIITDALGNGAQEES